MSEVTAEVATGLAVAQEKLIVQLALPEAIAQDEAAGVRVPDMEELTAQRVPFQAVPPAQLVVTFV